MEEIYKCEEINEESESSAGEAGAEGKGRDQVLGANGNKFEYIELVKGAHVSAGHGQLKWIASSTSESMVANTNTFLLFHALHLATPPARVQTAWRNLPSPRTPHQAMGLCRASTSRSSTVLEGRSIYQQGCPGCQLGCNAASSGLAASDASAGHWAVLHLQSCASSIYHNFHAPAISTKLLYSLKYQFPALHNASPRVSN
ncbi:uncharacterized protein MONOS_5291 [Monocercomonoides exilis]|uniref:uncharacterized protein n=1 Tax=Monocercomonoides exilis TaxID=2049356 RepID=UPI003559BED7|nr:hypothetical protein MONOS_5291 [Monocercomonoides exilis]|eukprot:MONOS_5291.1-p1 / transcript=MONOS_5291.1 / gene=MONOS_5291 / organism=Monocercomonoides_exilis_PA203 / gene_product=unspecified product / transcript_product=unspecified product / location=Mono_scaffold00152:63466-64439(-) / protein_length=201 / sequence_SO=supercontig / SO=protein_coding / is_pseudo=false